MTRSAPRPQLQRVLLLVATILTAATGCDKANGAIDLARRDLARRDARDAEPPDSAQLDLARHPTVLFQVFGGHDDPRMIPIAAIDGGALRSIVLSSPRWRAFDTLYMATGAAVTLYRDGRPAGSARVHRGMWEKGEPLYTLPGCQRLTPLAAVDVEGVPATEYTLEYLASSTTLGSAHPTARSVPPAEAARLARTIGQAVGREMHVTPAMLADLDLRAIAVPTGATREPTLVAAFMPPPTLHADARGGADGSRATHVFALADARPDGYAVTFRHVVNGPASDAEFRRYVDHLDLDGDGIDEIVLEGWRAGSDSFLLVLGFRGGAWTELFRTTGNWCLDGKG
ncbi:MAG: hypothetical protein ACJ79S_04825 [Gemmatimonadaceae bacterium]